MRRWWEILEYEFDWFVIYSYSSVPHHLLNYSSYLLINSYFLIISSMTSHYLLKHYPYMYNLLSNVPEKAIVFFSHHFFERQGKCWSLDFPAFVWMTGQMFNNVNARRATEHAPPERERSPARQSALATQADSCVALYIQCGDRTNNFWFAIYWALQ